MLDHFMPRPPTPIGTGATPTQCVVVVRGSRFHFFFAPSHVPQDITDVPICRVSHQFLSPPHVQDFGLDVCYRPAWVSKVSGILMQFAIRFLDFASFVTPDSSNLSPPPKTKACLGYCPFSAFRSVIYPPSISLFLCDSSSRRELLFSA